MTEDEAKPDIMERQFDQIIHAWPIAWSMIKGIGTYDAGEEYDKILSYIKDKGEPILLLLPASGQHGHCVAAYKILDLGDDEKRVYVYESGHPYDDPADGYSPPAGRQKSKDYFALFKPISNEASYSYDSATHGVLTWNEILAFSIWQSLPLEELLQHIQSILSSWLGELYEKAVMTLGIRCPVMPLITDNYGRRIGYIGSTFISEIPGAQMDEQLDSRLFYLPIGLTYSVNLIGTDTGVLGLDLVVPTSETTARVVVWEDIRVSPGSQASIILTATDVEYGVMLDTGIIAEPVSVGQIDASDIIEPTSTATLTANLELYYATGWLKNADIRDGLRDKLQAAQDSLDRARMRTARNQLKAFLNQVRSDGNVDPRAVDYLAAYTQHLIDNL